MVQATQPHNRPSSPTPQASQGTAPSQAGTAAQDLKDQVQETAGEATAQVKHTAQSLMGSQKDRVTQSLTALADTLQQAGQQLRQAEGGGVFASHIERAADSVHRLSGHLDEREVNELVGDLERYAHAQPAMFLGGTFALGVLGARFLRSSGQRTAGSEMVSGHQSPTPPMPKTTTPSRDSETSTTASTAGQHTPMPSRTPSVSAPVTAQGATPRPERGTQSGTSGASQPASASSATNRSTGAQHGTVPPQVAPLLPPNLDPRPGQRNPDRSRQ